VVRAFSHLFNASSGGVREVCSSVVSRTMASLLYVTRPSQGTDSTDPVAIP
jgi:hypothetical protein